MTSVCSIEDLSSQAPDRLPSQERGDPSPPERETRPALQDELFAVDSLVAGVVAMAMLTVVQKGIGFVRGVAFGFWLEDVELGRWSLGFTLLNLAAPLIVLGLPGTFGRYLGELLDRGHMKSFLVRTLAFSAVSAAAGIALLVTFSDQASRIFFGAEGESSLVFAASLAIVGVLALNVASEIFTALRVNRLVSVMQFLHAALFAVASVALLAVGLGSAELLIVVYGAAGAVAAIPGVRLLASRWRRIPTAEVPIGWQVVGKRVAAMAFWIWVINLLANLYDTADRYVLIHWAGLDAEASQALVGQYQSSLLLPGLVIGMGAAFGGALLPHLARSRAAGNVGDAASQLIAATKLSTVAFVAAGIAALWTAPLLFDLLWSGKYAAGESVLGLALIHGVWLAAAILVQNWLWCVEKPRWGALTFLFGLAANILFNAILAPRFGLMGVVVATVAGDAVALGMMVYVSMRAGLPTSPSLWMALALPLALACGALWGTALFIVVIAGGIASGVLVSREELIRVRCLVESTFARLLRRDTAAVSEEP